MSEHRGWGIDPGTATMGAVLCDGAVPIIIIDVETKAPTKGRAATKKKPAEPGRPKRFVLRAWGLRRGVPGEAYDLVQEIEIPVARTSTQELFRDFLAGFVAPPSQPEEATVERMVGNLWPDIIDQAGIMAGLLWARCGVEPKRPTSGEWRKRMLDIPGGTTANVAEAEAVRRVREEVPTWPESASGHAAEAYWIARFGLEA